MMWTFVRHVVGSDELAIARNAVEEVEDLFAVEHSSWSGLMMLPSGPPRFDPKRKKIEEVEDLDDGKTRDEGRARRRRMCR